MTKIKVGVVGLGHLGRHHIRIYSELKEAELIGGYDIDRALAEERCGALGTVPFSSYEELLNEIDALNIVVPTVSHYEVALPALKRGIHVLIEKPISRTVEEADSLIKEAKKQNCVLQVGHIERFNRAMRAVRNLDIQPLFIESQRLAPFNPRGTDVSVVHDLMIHDVDIVLSFVRSPLERIDAVGARVVSRHEDIANARLRFKNGCVANITASRIARKRIRKMRIFQHDTYIHLDFAEGRTELFRLIDGDTVSQNEGTICREFGQVELGAQGKRILLEHPAIEENGDALTLELKSFLHAIGTGGPPLVSGEDGRQALDVVHRIIEGAHEHAADVHNLF
ncbi:MAG: Gfo/Idh/MocA family oxidoreductase [Gemmatimonadota bacterium]|nr:MAG: Gfo/Idh/MocA family oxidoreductase [Gemmatimonadota bacterium]